MFFLELPSVIISMLLILREKRFLNKIRGQLSDYFILSLRSPLVAKFLKQIKTMHSVGYETVPNCDSGSVQSLD